MSRDQFRDRLVRGKRKGKRVYRAQQEVQNKTGQNLKGYIYCLTRNKESASFFAVVQSFFCFVLFRFFFFLLFVFCFVFCFVSFLFVLLGSFHLLSLILFCFFLLKRRFLFFLFVFCFLFVLFPVPSDQAYEKTSYYLYQLLYSLSPLLPGVAHLLYARNMRKSLICVICRKNTRNKSRHALFSLRR